MDDETWEVRYLVIDTKNWWFGRNVLIAPDWANRIAWDERNVHVDLSRGEIERSPEWTLEEPVSEEYLARLHDHYGRPGHAMGNEPDARAPRLRRSSSQQAGSG